MHTNEHEEVQVRGVTSEEVRTFYFGGRSATFQCYSRPLRCVLPDSGNVQNYVLTEYTPLAVETQRWKLASEVLWHVDSCITAFDAETDDVLFQNSQAAKLFGMKDEGGGWKEEGGTACTIKDWFATCVFDDSATLVSLWESIMVAKRGGAPLEFDCKKLSKDKSSRTWWHCSVMRIVDPASGWACILVQEKDTSLLESAQLDLRDAKAFQDNFFIRLCATHLFAFTHTSTCSDTRKEEKRHALVLV